MLETEPKLSPFVKAGIGLTGTLKPPRTGFRLRCGDYRLFFDLEGSPAIHVAAVRNRRDAYR